MINRDIMTPFDQKATLQAGRRTRQSEAVQNRIAAGDVLLQQNGLPVAACRYSTCSSTRNKRPRETCQTSRGRELSRCAPFGRKMGKPRSPQIEHRPFKFGPQADVLFSPSLVDKWSEVRSRREWAIMAKG